MFELLPWQHEIWQRVYQQHAEGRLPHALMLVGPKGVGKLQFADHLGASLLCKLPSPEGACGKCRSCELLNSGNHPDFMHLHPDEAGKVIKVDPVRELIDRLHATAQQGGYRVLIIHPAEEMNISAANALLKTLEEPGQDTLLLLVVDQLGQVMPTIRSRCQRLEFPIPAVNQAKRWLASKLEVPEDEVEGLVALSQGAPLQALDWKLSGAMELRAKLLSGLADVLRQRESPLGLAEVLYKEDLNLILNWWISLMSDIVHMKVAAADKPKTNLDMVKMTRVLGEKAATDALFAFNDQLIEERKGLLRHQNPNKQLMLEKLLFSWKSLLVAE